MSTNRCRQRGFTLVEMLVVLGIIAVLVGLLLPAVLAAVNAARRAQMALEISQLATGIEAYKSKFGDYPPSLRGVNGYNAFVRHVRRCYPKITSNHMSAVTLAIWPKSGDMVPTYDEVRLDEGESLTFWLSGIDNDPRRPFKVLLGEAPTSRVALYEFDAQRLVFETATGADDDGEVSRETGDSTTPNPVQVDYPSFRTKHAKDTCYLYIDSRNYSYYATTTGTPAVAEGGNLGRVRPYYRTSSVAVNPTSYQIICAGQDGEFGDDPVPLAYKLFPSGTNYKDEDNDNITNFSEGRRLEDNVP
jgi:prepilin-type N-terminal cleavage/methylation domain-containing protein